MFRMRLFELFNGILKFKKWICYNLNWYRCKTKQINWSNWIWYYDVIYLHVGHVATSVWFLHASHMTWPLRHWNIFVGGRISSKQTEHSNSLSKLDLSRSSISIPDKLPRLEATFSVFKRPPATNGFEAPDKGPHLIRDEHFCKILKSYTSLFKAYTCHYWLPSNYWRSGRADTHRCCWH